MNDGHTIDQDISDCPVGMFTAGYTIPTPRMNIRDGYISKDRYRLRRMLQEDHAKFSSRYAPSMHILRRLSIVSCDKLSRQSPRYLLIKEN